MNYDLSYSDTGFSTGDDLKGIGPTPDFIESMHKEGYLKQLKKAKGLSYRIEKDIYSKITDKEGKETQGPKIVSKGGIIDSRTFSDIVKRRLWERIDTCLSIDGQLKHDTIISSIKHIKEKSPIHRIIFETGKAELIEKIIKQIDFDKIMLENLNILYEQEQDGKYVQHAQNTAIFAIKIGTGFGLRKDTLIDLAKASYLHDIGKVAIDPKIWKKQEDELTGPQKRQIAAHPLIGEYILEGSTSILNKKYDMKIIRGIGDHHERPDSEGGFPRGIKGERIGDFARIIAIASKFDNMVNASMKGVGKSEGDKHDIDVIAGILDWLKEKASMGWYDPTYVNILIGFYTPILTRGIEGRESTDEIKAIQNIFKGIEKVIGFVMNLQYNEVKSTDPRAMDYCNKIYSNAFDMDRLIREAGLTEPLLLTYSQDMDSLNNVREDLKKTVSNLDMPLNQMREYIDKFEALADHNNDSLDWIIDSVTSWYDVIDKTLKNAVKN